MSSLFDICSIYIRTYLDTCCGCTLYRFVSLLPQPEQKAIIIASNDKYISAMFVSFDRIVHMTWQIKRRQLDNIYYYGHCRLWYYTGQLWGEGDYMNGKRTGYWRYWHRNGRLRTKGIYFDGCKEGDWQEFYDTGRQLSKGCYRRDFNVGHWQFWDTDGQLSQEYYYTINGSLVKYKVRQPRQSNEN